MVTKLITVWGSPGCGKSLLSSALGHQLAQKGKAAIIISPNKLTPMLPSFLPFEDENPDCSLARLLMDGVSNSTIKSKIKVHPNNAQLGIMALSSADGILQYQGNWPAGRFAELLYFLREKELAEYIIVDGTCDIFTDNVTYYALEHGDAIVQVISPDNRGLSYIQAHQQVFRAGGFHLERHIPVINNAFEYSPAATIAKEHGIRYILPHSPDLYRKFIAGQPTHHPTGVDGYRFATKLKALAKEVEVMIE